MCRHHCCKAGYAVVGQKIRDWLAALRAMTTVIATLSGCATRYERVATPELIESDSVKKPKQAPELCIEPP